ncbi:MAG: DNA mismatch endonuclease (patch repair protein) [Oceanospirillaceae bacterium]|jgi:DNA mismatch endonuclease (patch repair protein)
MADVHSKEVRSYNMSKIKGKDTKPELLVRKFLHKSGFRYSLHKKDLPGKPDIFMRKYKTVIFINGCFWHGHNNCKYFKIPKTRSEWWENKINKTVEKDAENIKKIKEMDFNVMQIWECQLKKDNRKQTLNELISNIRS